MKSTDISEEHIASIFRVEELTKKDSSMKAVGKRRDPEDRGNMLLRNVG
jgi:hypothetical protein